MISNQARYWASGSVLRIPLSHVNSIFALQYAKFSSEIYDLILWGYCLLAYSYPLTRV